MRLMSTALLMFVIAMAFAFAGLAPTTQANQFAPQASDRDGKLNLRDGRVIFRYDTFGDEQLWTDVLRMHEVIATVDPATALAVEIEGDAFG